MNLRWLSLGLALGLFASSAVSCGGAKQCSAANCPFGCCDSAGTCQSTVSNAQCGTNGVACMACPLGTNCSLGVCTAVGGTGGSGGGSSGTGGGTGGGGGTTGGGGGTTGGGSGGGSGNAACTALGAANTSFFGTRASCTFELTGVGQVTLDSNPNITTQCNAAIGQCTTNDRTLLSNLASCIAAAPSCTVGSENAAGNSYFECMNDAAGLSSACQNAINPGTGGGGGATGGGGGSVTGGGGGSVTGGGGGSVTGGGGGATGGGGGTSCRAITGLTLGATASYVSQTSFEFTSGSIENGTTAPMDVLAVEVIWAINGTATGVSVPGTFDLATQGTYATCTACVALCEGCSAGGTNCTKCYLARSGSVSIQQAPRSASGTFQASVSNVRAEAWNLGSDQPINDGTCLTVSSASLTATIVP